MCDFCVLFDFATTRTRVVDGLATIEKGTTPFQDKDRFNFCPVCGSPVGDEARISASFPSNLRRIRRMRGLTQEAVGRSLKVQKAAISKYERGRTKPNVNQLRLLCRALDVSPQELI